jgi:hypothetical protein
MSLSKKAIGKRFGLLAALVAGLVIACAGVVVAQSSSTANAGYGKPVWLLRPAMPPKPLPSRLAAVLQPPVTLLQPPVSQTVVSRPATSATGRQ